MSPRPRSGVSRVSAKLSEAEVFGAITNALAAHDIEAVGDFLTYAAPRWPERTAQVMETMRVALRCRDNPPVPVSQEPPA